MLAPIDALPRDDTEWLAAQPWPVIAYGEGATASADVVVDHLAAAQALERRIASAPLVAMTLVQVLRSTERLPAQLGLDVESLAYSTLQSGEAFATWLAARGDTTLPHEAGDALLLSRDGALVEAVLNRPASRNSITVEMRDAWMEALQLLEADDSIEELRFRGLGACFSVGGELREFGALPDPATAHWVRSVHSPARMLARLGERITFFVHGACLGSGIELPAFGARVVAHSRTFFQLPELQVGLIPGAGGTVSMTRRIGRQRVAWLVLSGRRINAQTALAWGLVDEVVDWF
jgi:enoyl-CoA hydratase/carnithine racemase